MIGQGFCFVYNNSLFALTEGGFKHAHVPIQSKLGLEGIKLN